ncbi:MAG: DUF4337 family protein [Polyangiaceae bacterium]
MSGAHEIAEHIEHAAHGGHGDKGVGRMAGITMAILGVMLALCSAMVGGQRTDVIATMVEQSNTYAKVQAQSMKFRTTMTELATLHALSPSHKELRNFDDLLTKMKTDAGKADGKDSLEVDAIGESTKALAAILQPKRSDMERTLDSAKRYKDHLAIVKKWADSYDEAVETHAEAAEHYEWGQLCAEIGIVIASIALLLANRRAWIVSVVLGSACAIILAWTFVTTTAHLRHANHEIAENKAEYAELGKDTKGKDDDTELFAAIEKKIAALPAPTGSGAASAAPATSEHPAPEHAPEHEPAPAHH